MKKVFFAFLTVLLLVGMVSCNGDVDEAIIGGSERTIRYTAGSGNGQPISVKTVEGYHEILPNSYLEISAQQTTKSITKAINDGYAGYYKRDFSFYGWTDQNGKYYVYNPDTTKSKIKFEEDVSLEALWRNDITGEVITGTEYAKITAYTGSEADTLIIPRVITIWDDPENPVEVLVTTIDTGAIADETLTTIILPDTITDIKEFAFTNCSNLDNVEIKSVEPPKVDKNALPDTTKIKVPEESEQQYKTELSDFSARIEKADEAPVVVNNSVSDVTLSPKDISLEVEDTRRLSYLVTPGNATNQSVTFDSSDTSVATVSEEGVVTAVAAGSATITVTTIDGSFTDTCNVTVVETTVPVTGITLSESDSSIIAGGYLNLTAEVTPSNATDKRISWASSDSTIARVDSNGKVTGLLAGSVVITATSVSDSSKQATCNVTVNNTVAGIYAITYQLHDGVAPTTANPISYTYGVGVASFNEPTRTGYSFNGWYDAATDGTKITSISTEDTGAKTLHAQWTANTYKLKFDGNGNTNTSVSMSDQEFTYDAAATAITTNAFTKTGYDFAGWTTVKDGEVVYADKASVQNLSSTNNDSITLYAKWTGKTYAITYELHSGSAPATANPTSYTYGVGVSSFNEPTRTGYTFKGWYDAATDGNKITSISNEATEAKTLHAQWTAKTYTITYQDKDGASLSGTHGTNHPKTHTYDTATTLVDPTKTGYTFNGWYTNSGCTDATKVTTLTATGYTDNITLYAKWTVNTYKIAFDKNGGSGNTMSEIDCTYGTPKNLTQNTYTRTDYTFLGWTTSTDGSGTVYTDQQSVQNLTSEANATVTLYAKWGAHHRININYNCADEPHPTNPTYYVEGIGADLSTFNKPTRAGYVFRGWNVDDKTEITTIPATRNTDITIFAFWLATHAIIIDYNYADKPEPENPTYYAEQIGADLSTFNKPTRVGYTFRGWYSDDTTEITNIPTTANTDIDFFAFWDANKYTVKFNGNGNTNTASMSDIVCTYDTAINLPPNTFEKTGYSFAGWATGKDGEVVYSNGQSIVNLTTEKDGVINLYAKWTANTYTITYKDNGDVTFSGTHGTNHPTTHTYDTATTLVEPTKTGYTFDGWYTNSGCTDSTKVTSLTATGYTGNITLYAKWTANTYTVKFNGNGNTNTATMSDIACSYDTAVNLTSNAFEKTGYTFTGWTTSTDGSGTVYTDQQSVQNLTSEDNATVTLYAKWAAHHRIIINYNGADEPHPTNPNYYVEGIGADLSTFNKPTREGYYFKGWHINNEIEITTISTTANTDISFFAYWVPTRGTASTSDTNRPSYSGINNACDWVQLWKDGPKWATMNIGSTVTNYVNATSYSTANVGGLYSWGGSNERREGAHGDDKNSGFSCLTDTDTATVKWGSNWRMPTIDEYKALIDNCTWTWCSGESESQYVTGCTLAGYKVSGKGEYAKNSIFLPAAGYYYGGVTLGVGRYWSSNPDTEFEYNAYSLLLNFKDKWGRAPRDNGASVHAVLK